MNKKEVSEIRKLLKPQSCVLTHIAGCYVNHEKEKVSTFKEPFFYLPEEEMFKYLDLLKKALGGKLGKTLHTMSFPSKEQDAKHKLLMALKTEKLENDNALDIFYDNVIKNYDFDDNYMILLAHGIYDIPGSENNHEEEKWSDSVYEHLFCLLCPVRLDKAALALKDDKSNLRCKNRDWIIEIPRHAFLFPAFSDRKEDVHSLLFYTRKNSDMQDNFLNEMFGVSYLRSEPEQKKAMTESLESLDVSYEQLLKLKDKTYELGESDDPLNADEIEKLCESCGVNSSGMSDMLSSFGCNQVILSNAIDSQKTIIDTGNIVLKVNNDDLHNLELRQIDGKNYFVIRVSDHAIVDGISIKL